MAAFTKDVPRLERQRPVLGAHPGNSQYGEADDNSRQ
jgi:hypothetical protein